MVIEGEEERRVKKKLTNWAESEDEEESSARFLPSLSLFFYQNASLFPTSLSRSCPACFVLCVHQRQRHPLRYASFVGNLTMRQKKKKMKKKSFQSSRFRFRRCRLKKKKKKGRRSLFHHPLNRRLALSLTLPLLFLENKIPLRRAGLQA